MDNATNFIPYGVYDTVPLIPLRSPHTPQENHASQLSRQASDSSHAPLLHNPSMSYSGLHGTPKKRSSLFRLADRLPRGWRFGATLAFILSTIVLFINIAVASAAYVRMRRNGSQSAIAPIAVGSCTSLKHTSLAVHLAINVASSLLLSGSNFCMQCISAPTRRDIDKAHEKGNWLDIAVPSVRNIRSLGPKRLLLWLSLGLSSIPLHLVYNSTFFLSTTHNSEYDVLFASDTFADGSSFSDLFFSRRNEFVAQYPNGTLYNTTSSLFPSYSSDLLPISTIQANAKDFQRLENADCISAYAKRILPERSNLILVTSTSPHDKDVFEPIFGNRCQIQGAEVIKAPMDKAFSRNLVTYSAICDETSSLFSAAVIQHVLTGYEPFEWICANGQKQEYGQYNTLESCTSAYKTLRDSASDWTVSGFKVDYCLSQEMESQCTFNVALSLLVVVIGFNFFKVGAIGYTLYALRDKPLITIGDAVDSFLVRSDPFTSGKHLLTKEGVVMKVDGAVTPSKFVDPYTLKDDRVRWWKTSSKKRWTVALILTFIALATILGLLALAFSTLRSFDSSNAQSIWELGLGTIDPRTLITGWAIPMAGDGAAIASILVANSPQLILSFIYIIFNSIFTGMSLAVEWSQYAYKSRTLRVSQRRGEQRSTYFLQVPYRLGIPVMIFSMVLHWLISQSIFLAKIDDSQNSFFNVTTCGFSPVGMISTFIAGVLLVAFAGVLGSMRLRPGMPLVGSCSLAISAACHAPEKTSAVRPLIWGALPESHHKNDPLVGPYGFYNRTRE